ncbi:hypothetical protein PENSPDRAFT_671929 [Peniophora sp. CONT]|nr:hypothetical protein PENSPDRAFT_671929 [Peniophora sp. CONT]
MACLCPRRTTTASAAPSKPVAAASTKSKGKPKTGKSAAVPEESSSAARKCAATVMEIAEIPVRKKNKDEDTTEVEKVEKVEKVVEASDDGGDGEYKPDANDDDENIDIEADEFSLHISEGEFPVVKGRSKGYYKIEKLLDAAQAKPTGKEPVIKPGTAQAKKMKVDALRCVFADTSDEDETPVKSKSVQNAAANSSKAPDAAASKSASTPIMSKIYLLTNKKSKQRAQPQPESESESESESVKEVADSKEEFDPSPPPKKAPRKLPSAWTSTDAKGNAAWSGGKGDDSPTGFALSRVEPIQCAAPDGPARHCKVSGGGGGRQHEADTKLSARGLPHCGAKSIFACFLLPPSWPRPGPLSSPPPPHTHHRDRLHICSHGTRVIPSASAADVGDSPQRKSATSAPPPPPPPPGGNRPQPETGNPLDDDDIIILEPEVAAAENAAILSAKQIQHAQMTVHELTQAASTRMVYDIKNLRCASIHLQISPALASLPSLASGYELSHQSFFGECGFFLPIVNGIDTGRARIGGMSILEVVKTSTQFAEIKTRCKSDDMYLDQHAGFVNGRRPAFKNKNAAIMRDCITNAVEGLGQLTESRDPLDRLRLVNTITELCKDNMFVYEGKLSRKAPNNPLDVGMVYTMPMQAAPYFVDAIIKFIAKSCMGKDSHGINFSEAVFPDPAFIPEGSEDEDLKEVSTWSSRSAP